MENIPPLLEIEERQQIQQRLSMKGATEPLITKATYYKGREGPFETMPRHMKAVIGLKGELTKH